MKQNNSLPDSTNPNRSPFFVSSALFTVFVLLTPAFANDSEETTSLNQRAQLWFHQARQVWNNSRATRDQLIHDTIAPYITEMRAIRNNEFQPFATIGERFLLPSPWIRWTPLRRQLRWIRCGAGALGGRQTYSRGVNPPGNNGRLGPPLRVNAFYESTPTLGSYCVPNEPMFTIHWAGINTEQNHLISPGVQQEDARFELGSDDAPSLSPTLLRWETSVREALARFRQLSSNPELTIDARGALLSPLSLKLLWLDRDLIQHRMTSSADFVHHIEEVEFLSAEDQAQIETIHQNFTACTQQLQLISWTGRLYPLTVDQAQSIGDCTERHLVQAQFNAIWQAWARSQLRFHFIHEANARRTHYYIRVDQM